MLYEVITGEDPCRQFCQNRRLISRAGADFQYRLRALQLQGLTHQTNHEGLRDGLPLANGQGIIAIGLPLKRFVDKSYNFV